MVGCAWFLMTLIGQDKDSLLGDTAAMSALSRPECLEQASKLHNCTWVIFDCYSHIGETFPIENPDSMYQASFAYLRSLYWAVVTLTAVGYGDIVAYSTAESYFAAFWIFVGGIINFGVVGAMSSTISTAMAPHHHYMEKINTLNHVLERIEISEHLSGEIRRFYHQQFTGRKQRYESQLLSHLPDQLCYKISSLLHSEAVKCIPLFNSASSGFLKEVTGQFRHRSYQNGETICLEGDVCRDFFVFLHNSKVNLFFRLRKAPVRALCNGDSYGVNELLLRRPYPATLRAASHVQASVMTRDQFDLIQRKFSRDVTDMKPEAEMLRAQEQNRLERIVANLEKLKLQPHSMHTPTLFYQRDAVLAPKGSRHLIRDVHSLRESFTAAWNALVTCWNVYNAFFVVFRVCFHPHLHFSTGANTLVWVADISCDVCFALDIYLRLYYLGCPEVGVENLLERKEIDKQYRRSSTLKWDILASLPVYTPFASGSWAANLCRVPRLVRCVDLWTYLDDAILLIQQHFASHNVSAYLSPVKLLVILVLVAHYVGCIFFWISERECQHVDKCWVDNDHLLHQYHHSLEMLYAKSFYWATTTLLLVGSRESTPRDMAGTLWTGFTCLCCTFIIGHIVGEISELILELGKETKHYKSHVASFESFATTNELPQALRERVTYFFRVQFEHTKGSDLFSTVHDLSANLRLKLMLEIYGSSIANLPICRYLTSSQVNNLALRLKPELFIPGDDILVEGTYGSRLCTLRKGMAAAFWTRSVAAVAILMEGAFFGEIAFFLPSQRRLATVKATTFCEVLSVSKHDWKELWASGGNAADDRVQKHALHAILGWVGSRLQRQQPKSVEHGNSDASFENKKSMGDTTADIRLLQFIVDLNPLNKHVSSGLTVYHLTVTPFKISFSPALIELSEETLQCWSAMEMFLDVLCGVDAVYQLQCASVMQKNVFSAANSSKGGLGHALTANPELRAYIVALLPLELLLLATNVRVPISNSSVSHTDASWWTTRWLLRMNRILLLRRIGPLSEQLFQFIVHDLKLPISEELLYFARGLSSYLATGHLLACIWFVTSETGFHQYGTSWLATSGMLTYISDGATVVEHTGRMLSQSASTFSLESVSLVRKYLRSLLFSIECISTLFYGDILSMNPLELVAEIAITFWSIYIYGALVGAQAELLDARAKREAKFEQRLGELHHYVLQNDVPKTLRRQIKYVVCDENEEIVMKGDVDRSMYFIAQGRVLVKTDASDVTRERGEYFGELTLLYGISRLETCVALTVAELYRLDHEPYARLLLEFPEYRARNRLSWTTVAEPERVALQSPPRLHRTLASRPSIAKVVPTTAENLEARLQFSFI
ncbi:hypothetical protein PInf_010338 [Phytophthora infestans]|nr:hypothetical protein PInf_010338 [Phytophthora infestans]